MRFSITALVFVVVAQPATTDAFVAPVGFVSGAIQQVAPSIASSPTTLKMAAHNNNESFAESISKNLSNLATVTLLSTTLLFAGATSPAHAENELSDKYGGKGFDSSLVDQNCLIDKCTLQAKACLADDPSCRKGLTCTAKCLGDNACITGCMARYGNENLDNLLKCTIEDNNCIKIAILPGGADKISEAPLPPAPTVNRFDMRSMEGSWYKVVGFNPNYDCYACQRNTFTSDDASDLVRNPFNDKLQVDVEFSMPRMMPDGSPPPPANVREQITRGEEGTISGSQTIGFNDYKTRETMVFDKKGDAMSQAANLILNNGQDQKSFARTAHSEGEMFGLKFWENWYVIGENDADKPEFKFVYYNGKTRQNTYEGAFVYSRTKELDETAMKKVYAIASEAGMNPDQFCKIRNGCFKDDSITPPPNMYRRVMASTQISQLLGVEPVAAEFVPAKKTESIMKEEVIKRKWWNEVGDYLENPHRHFEAMDSLRVTMDWPESVKQQ